MGEQQAPEDVQRAFRIVIAAIAAIVILGIVLLVTVVLLYRIAPGRHFPFVEGTPTAPAHSPSPG